MPRLRHGLALIAIPAIAVGLLAVPSVALAANSDIKITEWEYNGSEFFEATNVGDDAVDLSGWSFSDSAQTPGAVGLGALGTIAAGESFIVSEASAADFRSEWGIPGTVKVLGGNSANLGRSDEINLYDASSSLIDRLTYNDQATPGDNPAKAPRTDTASAWLPGAALGANTAIAATKSTVGDAEGSWASTGGFIGSPGISTHGTAYRWVVLNEIETNGSPDWVELFNAARVPVDVSGIVIKSVGNAGSQTLPASSVVPAGEVLLVNLSFGLKKNDTVSLWEPDGTTALDSYSWGDFHLDSYGRLPNGLGEFVALSEPSPGELNDSEPEPEPEPDGGSILINEVDSSPADWVEFYNPAAGALDISGYEVRDNSNDHRWRFPAGSTIAAGQFLVVDGDTAVGQIWDGGAWVDGIFAAAIGIGSADQIRLYNAAETLIDQTFAWSAHPSTGGSETNATYARVPDGVGNFNLATISKGATNAGHAVLPSVAINELNSNGGPSDYVEIINTGTTTVDLTGWYVYDNDPGRTSANVTPLPAGTSLLAGQRRIFQETVDFTFGLGNGDSGIVFTGGGLQVDRFDYVAHATSPLTWSACPEGGDAFVAATRTPGAVNDCGAGEPEPEPVPDGSVWPGSSSVTVLDPTPTFLEDSSGLDTWVDETGTYLYAVDNGTGTFWKLAVASDGSFAFAPGWENGKRVRFQKDSGSPSAAGPDTEGITAAGDGFVYVASERDNSNKAVNWDVVLKVDPNATGPDLVALDEWDITAALPAVDANLGIEAVEWVADSNLDGKLWDTTLNKAYDPADYPDHGDGLFFVAVEDNGHVYAFAFGADGAYEKVAEIDPGLGAAMALDYDSVLDVLWAVCDEGCLGTGAQIAFDGTPTPEITVIARPTGMPNLNNEGFATAPASLIEDGARPAWWFADGFASGSLRTGTLSALNTTPPVSLADLDESNRGDLAAPGTATAGQTITINADPAFAGDQVEVWLYSTPTIIASGPLGAGGSFTVTVPLSTPGGAHHLVLVAAGTSTVVGWAAITIQGAALAVTGFEVLPVATLMLVLVVSGLAAMAVGRRRRIVRAGR